MGFMNALKAPGRAISKVAGKMPGMNKLGSAVGKAPGMKSLGGAVGLGPSAPPQMNQMAGMASKIGQSIPQLQPKPMPLPMEGGYDAPVNSAPPIAQSDPNAMMMQPGMESQQVQGLAPSPQMTPPPPQQMMRRRQMMR